MSFTIIDEREALPTRPPLITIFGEPGVGKTSLGLTMPGKTLLLDADEGAQRAVRQVRASKTIKIDEYGAFWNWFMSDAAAAFIEENQIESGIIDTIGTLLEDKVTPWLISNNPKCGTALGGLSLNGWGALGTHFQAFKNRCIQLNLKVIAICHGKEEEIQDQKKARLAVKGGTKDLIPRISDMLGYVYLYGNKRVVDFNATSFHIGKNTAQLPMLEIPKSTDPKFSTFMATVYDATVEKMNEAGQEQLRFLEELDQYKQGLAECEKTTDFDAMIETLKDEPDKLMQTTVRKLLSDAMEWKGMKYDKTAGKVIKVANEEE